MTRIQAWWPWSYSSISGRSRRDFSLLHSVQTGSGAVSVGVKPLVCVADPSSHASFFFFVRQPSVGHGLFIHEVSQSHTQWHTKVGRTPLDEWSARRRDLYLTTHNTHNRQTSMPPVGFEPTISAGKRPPAHALDRTATGTGHLLLVQRLKISGTIPLFLSICFHGIYRNAFASTFTLTVGCEELAVRVEFVSWGEASEWTLRLLLHAVMLSLVTTR